MGGGRKKKNPFRMVYTGKEAMQYGHNSEKREGDSPKGGKNGKSKFEILLASLKNVYVGKYLPTCRRKSQR